MGEEEEKKMALLKWHTVVHSQSISYRGSSYIVLCEMCGEAANAAVDVIVSQITGLQCITDYIVKAYNVKLTFLYILH